jgi:hypothetical protein
LKGYIEENVQSCCFNCNFIKKTLDYDTLIHKLKLIFNYQKINPIHENENKEIKSIIKGNKLSIQEKKDIQVIRKKKQIDDLLESYSTEEKRKDRIDMIMKNRLYKTKINKL